MRNTSEFRRDLLAFKEPHKVSQACMRVLTHIQLFDKEVQLLALTGLFLLVCKKWNVHPPDAMEIVDNMMKYESKNIPEFRAANDYVTHQL